MTTSFFNSRTWLSLALFLGLLVALPTGANAQPSNDAKQRLAAALPAGVTPEDATAEQLAAAVASAMQADGITSALAGEIVEYALRQPAFQGLDGDAIATPVLFLMNSALDAAPPGDDFVNTITMATLFVVPQLSVEINAERVRRNLGPLTNAQANQIIKQPFEGNPPENELSRAAANPTPTPAPQEEDQQPPAQQTGAPTPSPSPTPAPLPPPPVDQPMTPVQNPGPMAN